MDGDTRRDRGVSAVDKLTALASASALPGLQLASLNALDDLVTKLKDKRLKSHSSARSARNSDRSTGGHGDGRESSARGHHVERKLQRIAEDRKASVAARASTGKARISRMRMPSAKR